MKNLDQLTNNQLSFLIHKLIKDKNNLLIWAKNENKTKLIDQLKNELELLLETEKRLEQK